ncbi:MAG TPA: FAD-dependent thymidylate synthase [Solirubrobacteraceae bacterium]|jgi:thymidylate synthase ThyX|nr:FAD-dependent thymidylate synthase [Solirubrobacteraceae bacterium]
MHETTPQVFLIARPSIDVEGMRAYLADVGGESWLQRRLEESADAPNGGELVVEFGGRACYRSWEPGLNPNVTKVRTDQREYFANILRSAHGSVLEHANYSFALRNVSRVFCYDAATEVLTEDGWKKWPDVDGSETFATVDPDSGALEYQKATEHFAGDYDGEMYRVRSEQVDLLVTPNHRMWVKAHDTQANKRGEEPYRVRLASEIVGKRVAYQKTANWKGQEAGTVEIPGTKRVWKAHNRVTNTTRHYVGSRFPLKEFARFLGHWLAEGSLNGHQICIAQNRGERLEAIAQNIRAMGLPAYEVGTGHGAVRTQNIALRDSLASCGRQAHEKRIPSYVHNWGPSILRVFLEAYVDGDGSRRSDGNHTVIYTTSSHMADDLQVLAIKAGWSANIRIDDRTGLERVMPNGQRFKNARACYIVSLLKTRTHPLVNHNAAKSDSWESYKGKVYCVKVPNGLLFVRRNGKPVVSGNTHELVRHRAGSAFSQESLRYVRLADIGFRVPPALEPVREQVLAIVEQLEEFQVSAASELGIDEEGVPFHVKKEVTSALRRLAPIGLSTDIIWTANARTLRHVIEMRTAPGAEEELRIVFDRIARTMQAEAPGLFQDFVLQDDGSWVPEHRKV